MPENQDLPPNNEEAAPDPLATEVTDFEPARHGRYLFRRPLAEGGLGVVSICFDTELNREVALKEIRDERADDTRARDNFCAEAQVTGSLEHPGVVPIYSLGADGDGRPYYAMQYITGTELRDRIVQFHVEVSRGQETFNGPGLRRLLQRLIDVCNVVHYAHSRGVLHRDLKSINVMLGRYGETFVIDWGLARTTGTSEVTAGEAADSGERNTESPVAISGSNARHTFEGAVSGTISYAPPEQLAGRTDQIDARSDVFSLGAILYEILTGNPPNHRCSLKEAIQRVELGTISSPSESQSNVPKPLSAIAMKSLSASRDDRYQSAKELRNDIQRWLDDEPVVAYSESRLERLYRWKRRHETFVRWATLSLLIVSAISMLAAYRIDLARQRQVQARQQATRLYRIARDATDNFLAKTGDRLEDLPDDFTQVREELLREAAKSYRQMQQEAEFADDPELMRESATAAIQLAGVLKLLDTPEDRAEAIEFLQRARATLRNLDTPEDAVLLARTYVEESRLLVNEEGATESEMDAAAEVLAEAMKLTEQWSGGPSVTPEALLVRGQAKIQQGNIAALSDDIGQATDSYQSAIDALKKVLDRNPDDAMKLRVRRELIRAYTNDTYVRPADDPRTREHYEAALRQATELAKDFPNDPSFTKEHGHLLNNFGDYYFFDLQDFSKAEEKYRQAAEILEELVSKKPSIPVYKQFLTLSLVGLGNSASGQGKEEQSRAQFQRAVEMADDLIDQSLAYSATAAQAHVSLGYATIKVDAAVAENHLRKAESLLSDDSDPSLLAFVHYAWAAWEIAKAQQIVGEPSESTRAEAHLDQAMQRLVQAIELSAGYRGNALNDEDFRVLRTRIEQLPVSPSE